MTGQGSGSDYNPQAVGNILLLELPTTPQT